MSNLIDWAKPGRLAALVSTRNTYPRVIRIYIIQRVNSRFAVALRTKMEDGARVVDDADAQEFRLSDGRLKGSSEYGSEALYPMDSPVVLRARCHRRIRNITADLIALFNDADRVKALTGDDYQAAIDMAAEIVSLATHANAALKGTAQRQDEQTGTIQ